MAVIWPNCRALSRIDTVLLTHAHLDHSGYIPALVRNGFRGKVICTPATRDLCSLLLPDSGYLQEEEAKYARKKGFSKHANPTPLYTVDDAEAALERFVVHDFDHDLEIGRGMRARFHHAGHILGAAQISLDVEGTTVHFSGAVASYDQDRYFAPDIAAADKLIADGAFPRVAHSSSVNKRERVRKRLPEPFSSENMPPLPLTTSIRSWVCFQYSNCSVPI